jgi:predicted DNA-binding transcriptional regulator YafY
VRLIVGWCELRNAFRHFRTDRVQESEFLEARYPLPRARLRLQWKKEMESSDRRPPQKGAASSNPVPVE